MTATSVEPAAAEVYDNNNNKKPVHLIKIALGHSLCVYTVKNSRLWASICCQTAVIWSNYSPSHHLLFWAIVRVWIRAVQYLRSENQQQHRWMDIMIMIETVRNVTRFARSSNIRSTGSTENCIHLSCGHCRQIERDNNRIEWLYDLCRLFITHALRYSADNRI